eukprot:scaffold805_cov110-Isochrysis_galbana.AAC.1
MSRAGQRWSRRSGTGARARVHAVAGTGLVAHPRPSSGRRMLAGASASEAMNAGGEEEDTPQVERAEGKPLRGQQVGARGRAWGIIRMAAALSSVISDP